MGRQMGNYIAVARSQLETISNPTGCELLTPILTPIVHRGDLALLVTPILTFPRRGEDRTCSEVP